MKKGSLHYVGYYSTGEQVKDTKWMTAEEAEKWLDNNCEVIIDKNGFTEYYYLANRVVCY